MKKLIALLLAVCAICSMLTIVASAAAVTREVPMRSETVKADFATIFSGSRESSEKLGMIWKGDKFRTSSDKDATWWYGLAGKDTEFYKKFGNTYGYVMSERFK